MNTLYTKAVGMAMLISCCSCKKFIAIETPVNLIGSGVVFEKNETANAAMLNVYSEMVESTNSNGFRIAFSIGTYVDELKSYSTLNSFLQVYANELIPRTSDLTNQIWSAAYRYIYQANAVIEGCEKSKSLNSDVKQQLTAEAKFIRAYWYCYLINLYGKVALVNTTDYEINQQIAQSDTDVVYAKIIADLKDAISGLKEDYVTADGVSKTDQRFRPNKFAAKALLARIYLYTGDYTNAKDIASEVIANTQQYEMVQLDDVFKTNNREAIWQVIKPLPNNQNYVTPEGNGFVLTGPPNSGSLTISPDLLNAFDAADLRKSNWIGKFTNTSVTPNIDYYYPNKYKIKNGSALTEASTVLRLAEQFLIRAEANANLGNLADAIADVDVVKKRAGVQLVKDKNPGIGREALLAEIFAERRFEFFTEWGHRFFDLKRSNTIDDVMKIASPKKQGTWETKDRFWCIPLNDILNNPNLKQNDGYQ
jgi:hypothetical protein